MVSGSLKKQKQVSRLQRTIHPDPDSALLVLRPNLDASPNFIDSGQETTHEPNKAMGYER